MEKMSNGLAMFVTTVAVIIVTTLLILILKLIGKLFDLIFTKKRKHK